MLVEVEQLLNNNAENRLVTFGSTITELDGEANLTFDGTTLSNTEKLNLESTTSGGTLLSMQQIDNSDDAPNFKVTKILAIHMEYYKMVIEYFHSMVKVHTTHLVLELEHNFILKLMELQLVQQ